MLLLFIQLGIGIIIFGSLGFFLELPHDTFHSIPDGFWWAVVTMTTIGYGDVVPAGNFGKCLTVFCGLFGICMIALPIPIIGNNYNTYYSSVSRIEIPISMSQNEK